MLQNLSPEARQKVWLYGAAGILGLVVLIATVVVDLRSQVEAQNEKGVLRKQTLPTAADSVDNREIWVDRIEKKARGIEEAYQTQSTENALLKKRLELLERALQGKSQPSVMEGHAPTQTTPLDNILQSAPEGSQEGQSSFDEVSPQSLRGQSNFQDLPVGPANEPAPSFGAAAGNASNAAKVSKILELSLSSSDLEMRRTVDNYVTSGTYAKGVLLTGSVASTATNAQSNPLPMIMRLVDNGHLPRGWMSTVKDARLIGFCYGDLSSERVYCRLESMSWVESDGQTVERSVEGWIMGEDGRPGIRGRVVDRAMDTAQQAFVAGILSGIGQFLQQQAQSAVFPISPFGQSNALKGQELAMGSVGRGASSALEKLADFAIRRMESMSPVLVVNSGRVVDIVFRKGFHLKGESRPYRVMESASLEADKNSYEKGE